MGMNELRTQTAILQGRKQTALFKGNMFGKKAPKGLAGAQIPRRVDHPCVRGQDVEQCRQCPVLTMHAIQQCFHRVVLRQTVDQSDKTSFFFCKMMGERVSLSPQTALQARHNLTPLQIPGKPEGLMVGAR